MDVVRSPQDVLATGGSARGPRLRAWSVVALLCAFMLINFADKVVVGLSGVRIMRDLGIDPAQFGVVQSGFYWLFAAGAIVGGLLLGRIPGRWLLAGLALIWALSMVPIIWSSTFAVLIASRVVLGFAEGPASALATAVTHSWFPPERRAIPSSIVTAGAGIGPLIAAPVLTAVLVRYSWHAAFAVLAVLGLVWVVLWLLVGGEGHQGGPGPRADARPERVPLLTLLRIRTIIGILIVFFGSYCNVAIKISWIPLYLEEGLGYDPSVIGILTALPYAATAVALVGAGVLSRVMTRRGVSNRIARGIFCAALVGTSGVATVAFAALGRGPLQMALIVVAAALGSAGWGVAFTAVSDVVPARQRGAVMGVIVAVYSIGGIVAPVVMGGLVNAAASPLDGYVTGFTLLGSVMIIGAIAGALMIDPDRDALSVPGSVGAGGPIGTRRGHERANPRPVTHDVAADVNAPTGPDQKG